MFLGRYEHTIDEKGRITIPAKFRDELGETVVVTQGLDGNLLVYPPDLFDLLAAQIRKQSVTDANSRMLRRIFFSMAEKIDFDKAGRILLPAFQRASANLLEMAVLVGNGEYFELWSPENWQVQLTSLNDVEANEQRFSSLDLNTLP